MIAPNLIVIGGSAGGVEALMGLVPQLPPDLDAAVCIVVHFPPQSPSVLPRLLRRRSTIAVDVATDGAPLESGHVYVAPPDWHLLIDGNECRLSHGPREHGYRPCIDALFRTGGDAYGRNCVGVVLSGSLDDGSAGLRHIRLRGGTCIVQDPKDATFPGMPTNAMMHIQVDSVVAVSKMAEVLVDTVAGLNREGAATENYIMASNGDVIDDPPLDANISVPNPREELEKSVESARLVMRCPDCGGVLQEVGEDGLSGFRCRVGHNFSLLSLLEGQGMALEQELWSAFNGLLERIDLCRQIRSHALKDENPHVAQEYLDKAQDAREAADILRDFLLGGRLFNSPPTGD